MEDFFRRLPKMTNNHIHLFALFPFKRLLKIIKKIDPELYHKIYVLKHDLTSGDQLIHKYTMITFNHNVEGVPFADVTTLEDWQPLSEIDTDPALWASLIIKQHIDRPFNQFERIQALVRILVRHYKIYYYLWYISLYTNYHNRIYYLNVRGRPGTINKDVRHGHRFFIDSPNAMAEADFQTKMTDLIRSDLDVKSQDIKFMYRQYIKIKYESDLILMAVNDFNSSHNYPSFVTSNHLLEPKSKTKIQFDENFYPDDPSIKPQMMVQYIITFPKYPKGTQLDFRKLIHEIKEILYIAVVINTEYGFQFFNGIDFVGNEQETTDLSDWVPYLGKLLYFRKYGIHFIPHIGETNKIKTEINPIERFILDKQLTRIGHGMSFVTTDAIRLALETRTGNSTISGPGNFYIESCPISNYLLGYYHPKDHPHRLALLDSHIKLMICSDDNGLFNYSTVTRDYMIIYKFWNITMDQIKQLILNGMAMIPQPYKKYYHDVFNKQWTNLERTNPNEMLKDLRKK